MVYPCEQRHPICAVAARVVATLRADGDRMVAELAIEQHVVAIEPHHHPTEAVSTLRARHRRSAPSEAPLPS